ncbi:MAG: serine/threonine-protein kinase [Myxococcota bacterium]
MEPTLDCAPPASPRPSRKRPPRGRVLPADRVRCSTCGARLPGNYRVCPHDGTPLRKSHPDDPLVGVVLAGTYRILRLLAQGGMGRLYEAEHLRLPRRLVAKVIHDAFAESGDAVRRFEREACAVARIQSDHVLDVVDVVRTPDDRPCIIAERLSGEDLQARLDRVGCLGVSEAVHITRQICRGLNAAHAEGVLHRDLKPSNVYLDAQGDGVERVKLLDFGVAKLADDEEITRTGAVVGTPAYMAPEQARASNQVDRRADIYGVGAILYRMVTGRAPHEASDPTASLARLLHDVPTPPRELAEDLPDALAELIERLLSPDPADRFPDAKTVELALEDLHPEPMARLNEPSRVEDSSEHTLILPRGAVSSASRASTMLRRARSAGVAGGVGLAFTFSAVGFLLGLGGGSAAAAGLSVLGASLAVTLVVRSHRRTRGDVPALRRLAFQGAATALGSLGALGVWTLGATVQATSLPTPLWLALVMAAGGAVGALVANLQSRPGST